MILLNLLQAVLHLFALALLIRLMLPERVLFTNPYLFALDALIGRVLNFLRTALPLPRKPLMGVALLLTLAIRTALSTKTGAPAVHLSAFAIAGYDVTHFLGWFWVELLRFAGFYLAVLSCSYILRLWHRGQPLPGYTGDILKVATAPFSRLKLPMQTFVLLLLTLLYVTLVSGTASMMLYPPAQTQQFQDVLTQLQMTNIFNFGELSTSLRLILLTGTTLLETLAILQETVFILIFMLIITLLTKSGPMAFFLMDLKRLLCGRLQPLRLGILDLTLPILFFVFGLIYTCIMTLMFFIAMGAAHVV